MKKICLAKIRALSKVEWFFNSRRYEGKVKQIFGDRASILTKDGTIYIVELDKLKKVYEI